MSQQQPSTIQATLCQFFMKVYFQTQKQQCSNKDKIGFRRKKTAHCRYQITKTILLFPAKDKILTLIKQISLRIERIDYLCQLYRLNRNTFQKYYITQTESLRLLFICLLTPPNIHSEKHLKKLLRYTTLCPSIDKIKTPVNLRKLCQKDVLDEFAKSSNDIRAIYILLLQTRYQ